MTPKLRKIEVDADTAAALEAQAAARGLSVSELLAEFVAPVDVEDNGRDRVPAFRGSLLIAPGWLTRQRKGGVQQFRLKQTGPLLT